MKALPYVRRMIRTEVADSFSGKCEMEAKFLLTFLLLEGLSFKLGGDGFCRNKSRRSWLLLKEGYTMNPDVLQQSGLIPLDVLFGINVKSELKLSPDGKRLSYLAPSKGVMNIWVGPVGGDDFQAITDDRHAGINFQHFWAYDNEHILYLQDCDGDENYSLYSVNINTRETRNLTPFENVRVAILRQDKHFPNELIIAMNKENPAVFDIYRLNIGSGELTLAVKNDSNPTQVLIDSQWRVRGIVRKSLDGKSELFIREREDAEWVKRTEWGLDDEFSTKVIGFSKDGESIYLADSRQSDTGRLVKWNLLDDTEQILAEFPHYEIAFATVDNLDQSFLIHPDTYQIQAVAVDKQRKEWVVLDESIRGDFAALRTLHAGDVTVFSRADDDQTWLVGFIDDKGPAAYYLYERKTRKGTFLMHDLPELAKYELAEMEPIAYEARDGLTIEGYIMFPPGIPKHNLPMVMYVHGGPWGRVSWGYSWAVGNSEFLHMQWLANRGYACMTVNFRGSTGYGKKFVNAGDREWAGKMHDDLVDGVKWAVDKGYADPAKVAIYGGSYGGYAALVGAAFTPDLFCCAVSVAGPSNLLTLIRSVPPYWEGSELLTFHQRIGNPDTDEAFLRSRSPLYKVDQIKCPILIAMGANDPRVPVAESEQIVAEMEKRGLEYEYMLFPDEGHGLIRRENRLAFHQAAERFFSRNLGVTS